MGIGELGQGIDVVILRSLSLVGCRMQTRHDVLQLPRVLQQLALLLAAQMGKFLSRQVIALLTLGETGIKPVDAATGIPDDCGSHGTQQDDGSEQGNGGAILATLLLLFVELSLDIDDTRRVAPLV